MPDATLTPTIWISPDCLEDHEWRRDSTDGWVLVGCPDCGWAHRIKITAPPTHEHVFAPHFTDFGRAMDFQCQCGETREAVPAGN